MNAALEILGFSKFLKALFPYGTHMYHCASKDNPLKYIRVADTLSCWKLSFLTNIDPNKNFLVKKINFLFIFCNMAWYTRVPRYLKG